MLKQIYRLLTIALLVLIVQFPVLASEESAGEEVKITGFVSYNILSGQTATYQYDIPAAASSELTLNGKYGTPLSDVSTTSIFGEDDRYHTEETEVFPNRFICYIETTWSNGTVNKATGWLCGPSTMMTVAHNVYDPDKGWPTSIRIWPGRNKNTAAYGSARGIEIHMPAAYKYFSVTKYDVALIYLNTPIGSKTGYFGIKYRPESYASSAVFIAGYPLEKNKELWKDAGRILRVQLGELHYTIDTESGQSGSPIYLGSGAERYCVGIHNGSQSKYNVGNQITLCIFNWIKNKRK